MTQKIDISTSTLFRFILIILGLVFLYLVRDILLMIFIALIIAAAIDAPVDWMAQRKIRRVFWTMIVYILIFLALILFIYLVFPPLASQIKILASNLPEYLEKLGTNFAIIKQKIGPDTLRQILDRTSSQLSWAGSNILGAAVNIFGGIFSAAVILVISMYLVIQDKGIKDFLASITPSEHRLYVLSLTERIQVKLGAWLRGQLLLILIVGALVFIGLTLLKVNFALTLAILAGVLEIIPYIGPILAGLTAVLLAFLQSPLLSLLVLILFIVIHQLEGYVIVPQVMKRVVGLNPLVVMIAIIVGGKLGGVLGVVVAVPLVAAASVFFSDMFMKEEK